MPAFVITSICAVLLLSAETSHFNIAPEVGESVVALAAPTRMYCQGNACGAMEFFWEKPCRGVRNKGSRKVKAEQGVFSCVLNPGQSCKFRSFDGSCPGYIMGEQVANYAD